MSFRPPSLAGRVSTRGRGAFWALLTTVLVALNLRAAVTSLGPVLPGARRELGLSAGVASVATAAPVLCFGLLALVSPWLARRIGLDRAMAVAVVVLFAGLVVRPAGGEATLLLGTMLCCSGIAVANVLLPAVVKDRAPTKVGLVTGAYTAALAGGSALAAGITAPLAEHFGLRISLWVWAAPVVLALLVWLPEARIGRAVAPTEAGEAAPHTDESDASGSVWRSPVGWALAVLFGTQATLAYVTMGWLPTVLQWRGMSASTAGVVLAVSILVSVPVSALVPSLAARRYSQVGLVVGLTALAAAGLAGLTFAPVGLAWVCAAALGVGNGVFPLTLTLFSIRARSARETQDLSAMGQGVGYLLAAPGPFVFGVVGASTGSWSAPVIGLLVVLVLQAGAGMVAGRPRRPVPQPAGVASSAAGQRTAAPC